MLCEHSWEFQKRTSTLFFNESLRFFEGLWLSFACLTNAQKMTRIWWPRWRGERFSSTNIPKCFCFFKINCDFPTTLIQQFASWQHYPDIKLLHLTLLGGIKTDSSSYLRQRRDPPYFHRSIVGEAAKRARMRRSSWDV